MRLLLAVITTIIWEAILVGVWMWGLPALNIILPLFFLIIAMVILVTYAVFSYRMSTKAYNLKEQVGNTIGSRAKVVRPLCPEGMVNIQGELWNARSTEGNIAEGEEVEVVSQERLKLFVRRAKH